MMTVQGRTYLMIQNFRSQILPIPFLRRDIWDKYHFAVGIPLDLSIHPHILVLGNTGAGKSVGIKVILGHILSAPAYEKTQLIVCDYKGLDYDFLSGQDYYFSHDRYGKGLDVFKGILDARIRKEDMDRTPVFLVLDEWNNFIMDLAKKDAERYLQILSYSLNMGRAYQLYVVVGAQTAHAEWFGKARDSFSNIVGLGQLSKEAVSMMFSAYKEQMVPCPRGCGYLLQDGLPLKEILIPRIRNMKKLDQVLIDGISR